MSQFLHCQYILAMLLALATPRFVATYTYNMPPSRYPTASSSNNVASTSIPHLITKLLHSPTLDTFYKDYVVTSKPLNLRKYKNGSKTKKTKKDSKIYYIPIPPLPYRYIPGIGYDYQPMKIKPILQEATSTTSTTTTTASPTTTSTLQSTKLKPLAATQAADAVGHKPHQNHKNDDRFAMSSTLAQSKILRAQHHNEYFFNGRPFRLQVAHAGRKNALTPHNLKSKLYYNKNIIY